MAWLAGWLYRRPITITGSSGAGTEYQVLLRVGESSGATGCDFHLNGHSANFPSGKDLGGDLRFTASDGATLLSFWVEEVEGTSPNRVAYIWVKVSADLNETQTIFCYFGNQLATNASNGDDTFLFFDDFLGTTLDTTKWQVLPGGTVGVSDSEVVLMGDGTYRGKIVSSTFQATDDCAIIAKGRVADANNSSALVILQCDKEFRSPFDTPSNGFFASFFRAVTLYKAINKNLTVLARNNTDPWPDTAYHTHEIRKSGSRLEIWTNGSNLITAHDTTLFPLKYIGMTSIELAYTTYFDFVFVRKYVYPEPAFSSAGEIEVLASSRRLLLMPI